MSEKAVFCVDCAHYKEDPLKERPLCLAFYPMCFDLVVGVRTHTPTCRECRANFTKCAAAGYFYEPREYEPSTLFDRCRDISPPVDGKIKVIAGRGDREVK